MYQRAWTCPPARWTPCVFASKSLTTAQQSYVAIELEALAVSWAVQKFHHYLYGTSFTLQTDQKPLQAILRKSLVEATPQMQRLLLPTIPYEMAVEYIKGETTFTADCLSRAPVAKDTIKLPILQVNQITAHARGTQHRIVQYGWPQTITALPPEVCCTVPVPVIVLCILIYTCTQVQ